MDIALRPSRPFQVIIAPSCSINLRKNLYFLCTVGSPAGELKDHRFNYQIR
jgi:hypothetical protein